MAIAGSLFKKRPSLLFLIPILAIFYLWSCGSDESGDVSGIDAAETVSAGVKIRWHHGNDLQEPEKISIQAAPLDCQASGIRFIVCDVYDDAGNHLAVGGPWDCSSGGGRIGGIPVGSDRIFVVLAQDENEAIRYHGRTTGVAIAPNQVTENIVIDAFPFIPELRAPEDGEEVDPNTESFVWELSEDANAYEYLLQVAEDADFQTLIIDEIVPRSSYLPATLAPSMAYFWRVSAFDEYGNMGAASEAWSLTTSNCTYTISSPGDDFGPEGGSGSFDVASSQENCEWSASAGESWIEITSGANGSDSGTVSYTIAANTLSSRRTGVINVGGQQHTITQEGVACTYDIAPAGASFTAQGGSDTIAVTSSAGDCPWSASADQDWIRITSGASGSGNGAVNYTVAANPSSTGRTGVITAGGRQHTVTQQGAACTYEIAPAGASFTSEGGSGAVRVTSSAGDCSWSASASQTWIRITSGADGSGNGAVNYTVAANTSSSERTGVITVGGRRHTVTQEGVGCTYGIDPAVASFASGGGSGTVRVTSSAGDCSWSASASQSWIQITSGASGSGNGAVNYTVAAYTGTSDRTAEITVAGRTHRITQEAAEDTTSPSISITSPTADATYATTSAVLSIGGTADDNVGVTGVTWTSSNEDRGDCSGTDTWQANGIALVPGENIITVTARDAAGNTGTDSLTVTYRPAAPDYTIADVSVRPLEATAGSAITVGYTVGNQGGVSDICVSMAAYLSTDAAIDTADSRLARWELPECNLAAGQSFTRSRQITIPSGTATGNYYVGVIVDADNDQAESNESNNSAAAALFVEGAVPTLCSTRTEAGQDTPETFSIEMGQSAGTFLLEYNTQVQQDNIIVRHDGEELWSTGCVGASGRQYISYSGNSSQIVVEVIPNCNGGSGTAWEFTAHCPEEPPAAAAY